MEGLTKRECERQESMEDARREKEWKRAEEKGNASIQRTPFVGNINSEVCSPRHFLSLQTKEEVYHNIP